MQYDAAAIEALRNDQRLDIQILGEHGLVKDLSRDNVIVHVGKPAGSITGWVGPVFWQVWVESGDAPGSVHARVDRGEAQVWQFHESHAKEELLAAAKDSAIALAKEQLAAQLDAARERLSALESADA
ncbi:hypothetical protein [Amaricoccus solimangrovi]|uniref:Uncharacterized protein n=1 Tax=Amaricoccus solimangrovi TaxID=2589815 RepID=A0A501WFR2_9RHOB|nr:hypothetical protein [Amaricoccus solimangrovi]TPE47325.1 hypothetical protein FJM51_20315 [Amaricoccus solimangrovi]